MTKCSYPADEHVSRMHASMLADNWHIITVLKKHMKSMRYWRVAVGFCFLSGGR